MAVLRRIIPTLFPISHRPIKFNCLPFPWMAALQVHSNSESGTDMIVNALLDSLRKGWKWDALNRKFDYLALDKNLIENVLLELKEPVDAKHALMFFHWCAKEKNFEHGIQTYCIAVNILVRAQLLRDAKALMESILKKIDQESLKYLVVDSLLSSYKITGGNPLVFDLLIQAYAKKRMFDISFDICCYLEGHGFSCSLTTYNTLIYVVQKSDEYPLVWMIYEHMIKKRTHPSEATIKTMINSLCKEGKLQMFGDMLDRIHGKRCAPAVIINASLVFRVLEEGRIEEGVGLLKRLLQKNMIPDTIASSLIIYSNLIVGDIELAWRVHEEMINRGFSENSFVYTAFIRAYCRVGRIDEANKLMQKMENKGLNLYDETFNLLILGLAKAGRFEESLGNCKKMIEMGLVPTCYCFNEMVANLSEVGHLKQANEMLTLLLEKGFSPDVDTYALLIAGYRRNGNAEEARKLYYEMRYRGLLCGQVVLPLEQ